MARRMPAFEALRRDNRTALPPATCWMSPFVRRRNRIDYAAGKSGLCRWRAPRYRGPRPLHSLGPATPADGRPPNHRLGLQHQRTDDEVRSSDGQPHCRRRCEEHIQRIKAAAWRRAPRLGRADSCDVQKNVSRPFAFAGRLHGRRAPLAERERRGGAQASNSDRDTRSVIAQGSGTASPRFWCKSTKAGKRSRDHYLPTAQLHRRRKKSVLRRRSNRAWRRRHHRQPADGSVPVAGGKRSRDSENAGCHWTSRSHCGRRSGCDHATLTSRRWRKAGLYRHSRQVRPDGGPPSIFDAEQGKITGVSLTFYRHDDRVLVEGNNTSPTSTTVASGTINAYPGHRRNRQNLSWPPGCKRGQPPGGAGRSCWFTWT